ncbi:putative peptidoglycan-binding domain 1 protein [Cladorrhinum sp. PSN332]|nr:putative peptidoglycan-binding domain 1 protein [Cladorrhinum sp. PSN332]
MKPINFSSLLVFLLSTGGPVTGRPTAGDALAIRADGYCDTSYTRYITPNGWRITYPSLNPNGSGGSCIMNVGAKGSGVKSVQEAINKCYDGNLEKDGDYGELTKKAVKKVQKKIGVAQDGIWGPKTGGKMEFWGVRQARPDRPDLGDVHGCVALS